MGGRNGHKQGGDRAKSSKRRNPAGMSRDRIDDLAFELGAAVSPQFGNQTGAPTGYYYFGRPALSSSLAFVASQWEAVAKAEGIDYESLRPPYGVRYLGAPVLRELKSLAKQGGHCSVPVLNTRFRGVAYFDQILEDAAADPEFDYARSQETIKVFGVGVCVDVSLPGLTDYHDTPALLCGVLLSSEQTPPVVRPSVLQAEKSYFAARYDPLFKGEQSYDKLYAPLGISLDMESSVRLEELFGLPHPIVVTLGKVGLQSAQIVDR
jgi:hypothetical protein